MQITPLPVPVVPTPSPQEAAKTVTPVLAQATAPVTQRSIDPASKGDRGHKSRNNGDRRKGGDKPDSDTGERGHNVNVSV